MLQKVDMYYIVYNKRIGKEHNFFDLKNNNGLSRINWRGKRKCNTISTLAGIAYNLKKLQKTVAKIGWNQIVLAIQNCQKRKKAMTNCHYKK